MPQYVKEDMYRSLGESMIDMYSIYNFNKAPPEEGLLGFGHWGSYSDVRFKTFYKLNRHRTMTHL